jgi:sugar phosphate isomerase/epimerase
MRLVKVFVAALVAMLISSMGLAAIRALQLSDANVDVRGTGTQPPTRDRLLPGDGVMPLTEIVRLALANRADVSLGLEVFNRELAQLPYTELAVRAKAALDALLSAVAQDG